MFNIGPGELMAIAAVALIVLGPQRLPQALRAVGRVLGELRRISGGFQDELRRAIDESDVDGDGEADVTEGRPPLSSSGSPEPRPSGAVDRTGNGPATTSPSSDASDDDEPDRMLLPADTPETEPSTAADDLDDANTNDANTDDANTGDTDDTDDTDDANTGDASSGGGERAVS